LFRKAEQNSMWCGKWGFAARTGWRTPRGRHAALLRSLLEEAARKENSWEEVTSGEGGARGLALGNCPLYVGTWLT
jgi:hypothetical protein